MDDRLIYFSSFHSLPFPPSPPRSPGSTLFRSGPVFIANPSLTVTLKLLYYLHFLPFFRFSTFFFSDASLSRFNGRFIHLIFRWQECAIFCNVIHFRRSELLMAAKKLLECCSNEEEIVKALNFHSPLEESNVSGLKRVRRNRCLDESKPFFRFSFLSKKKKISS